MLNEQNQQNDQGVEALIQPLYEARGWMKFAGVISIIGGALQALSIVGILIAWLPIWMGSILFSAANHVELAYSNGDTEKFILSLRKLKLYFVIVGILTVLGVVVGIIGLLAAIAIPNFIAARDAAMSG